MFQKEKRLRLYKAETTDGHCAGCAQCVANTIRVLADQGFRLFCVEDCCAAGEAFLHEAELKIMNIIYCTVISTEQALKMIAEAK